MTIIELDGHRPAPASRTGSPGHHSPRTQLLPAQGDDTAGGVRFLWLDLTRSCQLSCGHCYNRSGPDGDHGTMTRNDWFTVVDQAVQVGVQRIQLIGGEPTLHPDFPDLLEHALAAGLQVEVFSNLVHVKDQWWPLLQRPGVSLATSYYSGDADTHNNITGRDSHRKTRANIARAVALGIPVRAGVIEVTSAQHTGRALDDLQSLGVNRTGADRLRHLGRGQGRHPGCDTAELCGKCGHGRAAIGPDGQVTPCAMATWLHVGNVRTTPLATILTGTAMAQATATIPTRPAADPCEPGADCQPDAYPCYPDNE